ncbi:NAD(P)/FAD-dependent oxidoreductase [Calorimonas adulescens]|uniref:NADH:ubiquinone reductase (non-electrogenic) n=1 Tax=Calorimonas adulescens TaxID=2606906 RepID=A0A5D8QH79_9THEO|nr:NAD(P)/FAD-dependent oxidoreductase [Calorimonas adulescens]TZE83609.1 NAD(P)/FAD-dependent oxidoreductase [Calorimonas adulescens]
MAKRYKIIVLGGGFGGLAAAQKLDRYLWNRKDVEITLINKTDKQVYMTELHEVAGNRIPPEGVLYSLKEALESTRVKLVIDNITRIDVQNKKLYSDSSEYEFDYLIVGCGSQPTYFGIPGMKENAMTLWSLEDAIKIRDHILDVFEAASKEKDPEIRRSLLTFIVGGGGFTGIELVGEFIEWFDELAAKYNISRNEIDLRVVEALPNILPNFKVDLRTKAENYLKSHGVKLMTNSAITAVEPDSIALKSGEKIFTKTFIWTGGVEAEATAAGIEGIEKGRRGKIKVNSFMQTNVPYVYAIGDCAEYVDENGVPMPALVESAMQSGECAARNIASDITGKEKKPLKLNLHGNMVSIGSKYAVSDAGGIHTSGLIATVLKHAVDMHYLLFASGIGMVIQYMSHQFMEKKTKVGFWIHHAKVRTSMTWLVPLRIFLGIQWLIEGINKINSGWLTTPNLIQTMIPGAAGAVSGASQAAEAVTSATQAAPAAAAAAPGWYMWFMQTFVFPNALFFQWCIALGEALIGILLILGLLTVLAGLGSIFLNINFMLSGMGNWWYMMSSIPMLAGAGRSFGLDYWFVPWIAKSFKHWYRGRQKSL